MLMRFDPFRELDRLTEEALGQRQRSAIVPLDAYRQGDRFFVRVDLPGVDPASIDLTVEKNVLTVTAERRWQPEEGMDVLVAEPVAVLHELAERGVRAAVFAGAGG